MLAVKQGFEPLVIGGYELFCADDAGIREIPCAIGESIKAGNLEISFTFGFNHLFVNGFGKRFV